MRKIIIVFFTLTGLLFSQTATLKKTLELVDINGIKVPYQNNIPLPVFEKQKRTIIDLRGDWKKFRFTSTPSLSLNERDSATIEAMQIENYHASNFDDSSWETKQLPAVENEMHEFPTVPERYDNGVWYRYKFLVPDSLQGKLIRLNFIASNYVTDVWVNDKYIGYHEGGYTPFAFDVSKSILFKQENIISIRIDNIKWGTRKDIVPFIVSDWFNYAGLIHDIYLEFANQTSLVRADVIPIDLTGNIKVNSVITNNSDKNKNLETKISVYKVEFDSITIKTEYSHELATEAVAVSGDSNHLFSIDSNQVFAFSSDITVENPLLWTPKEPNLYVLKIQLFENGKQIDELNTQFGIRTIKTNSDKVLLNDNVVFLTGAARHEDHPVYGRSLPKEIIYSDLKLIKESNILYLRTAHYPNHPYTYLITDRLGLAVMEEIPVWWFNTEESWQIQNNDRHIHQQMFREMVFKDFNRPSIMFWSTSNECKDEPNRLVYHETIMNDIHSNYSDGRLITQSAAADLPGATDITQAPLDVAGWTMYFGIFHGSTYYNGTLVFLAQAKNAFPGKPVMDTEFGYWSSENGSSTNQQITVFNETFKAFKYFSAINSDGKYNINGHLAGTTWWCVFDWYTYHQTTGYQTMGLISMDRKTKKPVYSKLVEGYKPWADIGGMVVSVDETEQNLPIGYKIFQNYPNPFNPSTKINFSIPSESHIKINLFNTLGEKIMNLVDSNFNSGIHECQLNGELLSSGIYFIQMDAKSSSGESFNSIIKVVLLK